MCSEGVTSTVSFSETGGSLAKPSEGLLKSQNAFLSPFLANWEEDLSFAKPS